MPWAILLGSAVLEAVWATALGESQGFTRLWPSVIFGVAVVLSMLGLGRAMRDIPIGTAYAVWTGAGAALTVAWAMVTGSESVSVMKIVFLTGIIVAVVGLQVAPDGRTAAAADRSAAQD